MLVSRCSSVEVGTDQEVDAEEANAAYPAYITPASASVTMASSISLLNKWVLGGAVIECVHLKEETRSLREHLYSIVQPVIFTAYHHQFHPSSGIKL